MKLTDMQTNQGHTYRQIYPTTLDRSSRLSERIPQALHAHNGRLHCAVARYVLVRVNLIDYHKLCL